MKQCIVISQSNAFVEAINQALQFTLEPWGLQEAVALDEAKKALREDTQLVIVDECFARHSLSPFLTACSEKYPNTWFVSIGSEPYQGVEHLELPLQNHAFAFFMQNPRAGEEKISLQSQLSHVYPILMDHFWTGLLNEWILPEETMIMMAAKGICLPGLEHNHILPILMKTVHHSQREANREEASRHHLYFLNLIGDEILRGREYGTALDRFSQKWAILLYVDRFPISIEEIHRRCTRAMELADQEGWKLSFFIGKPILPAELFGIWQRLEHLSERDVGYAGQIVPLEEPGTLMPAPAPDMVGWRALMENNRYEAVLSLVSGYITKLAEHTQLDTGWLYRFRDDFLLETYHAIQFHGIPAELILTAQLVGEEFSRCCSSIPQLLGWVEGVLNNFTSFVREQQADTVVKRARKYILQNLDQPLGREEIAAQVYVSTGYLGRLFKKELGVSLSEYIFTERMKLAAKMLTETNLYITTIALNVGYSNFPYFSTQFKKYSGYTPVEYRRLGAEAAKHDPNSVQN